MTRATPPRSKPESRPRRKLEAALAAFATPAADGDAALARLVRLVDALRPRRADAELAALRLQDLIARLEADPLTAAGIGGALRQLFGSRRALRLLSDVGIRDDEGFADGLWRRIGQRLLPDRSEEEAPMRAALHRLFRRRDDHRWVVPVPDAIWIRLLATLRFDATPDEPPPAAPMHAQLLDALQVVSYRIAAIGLDPELVRNHPAIERYESPFVMQNVELRHFLDAQRAALTERRASTLDDRHLQVLLDQCADIVQRVRRQAESSGTSMRLSALLLRQRQMIQRQRVLLRLCGAPDPQAHREDLVALFKQMVRAECQRHDLRHWGSQSLELLALRITHNAGNTGEKYVSETRAGYNAMFRSATGAGVLVAVMALIKLHLSEHHFAPLLQAVTYSLNYGLGFVLIYLLHFTIATKQPAMTAAFIARALDRPGRGEQRIGGLADLIVCTARSQFVAVVGNVTVAFAVALSIAWAWWWFNGVPVTDRESARALLAGTGPIHSPALLYAAIAGVWLFCAGLIAGYWDNRAVYSRIGPRLARHPLLRRLLGAERAARFGDYVASHLGGIAGNFFLGCMLGSTGALGTILGLPLDIRHVTFSTAHVAYGWFVLGPRADGWLVAEALLGIGAIAVTNLVVSFTLALFVAMRAQRVQFAETRALFGALAQRARTVPSQFFWPPADRPPAPVRPEDGGAAP